MKRTVKIPGSVSLDEALTNLKSHIIMEEKPKTKIQELHDANGTIYALIEHLHSLEVPLGLVYQKLRETTTEIQGAIAKLIDQSVSVQKPVILPPKLHEDDKEGITVTGKNPEIIVEYDTKKK